MADVREGNGHAARPGCTRHPERPAVVALVLDRIDRRAPVTTRFLCQACHTELLAWWYDIGLDPR